MHTSMKAQSASFGWLQDELSVIRVGFESMPFDLTVLMVLLFLQSAEHYVALEVNGPSENRGDNGDREGGCDLGQVAIAAKAKFSSCSPHRARRVSLNIWEMSNLRSFCLILNQIRLSTRTTRFRRGNVSIALKLCPSGFLARLCHSVLSCRNTVFNYGNYDCVLIFCLLKEYIISKVLNAAFLILA